MPGSGVRAGNIVSIARQTGTTEFHSSARAIIAGNMQFSNAAMNEQLQSVILDEKEVKAMLKALSGL